MQYPDSVILIFSKAPVAGQVKTRLVPYITAQQAASLHQELARDRVQMCSTAGLCDVQLWCSPDTAHPFFVDCARSYGVQLHTQRGSDLGERMLHALQLALDSYSKVVIIGTDAPALDAASIKAVLQQLDSSDVVLVPAEDGGYVLIASTRYHSQMLADVSWGSGQVLASTVRNFEHLGLEYCLLGGSWDVDRPADLERYRALKV